MIMILESKHGAHSVRLHWELDWLKRLGYPMETSNWLVSPAEHINE